MGTYVRFSIDVARYVRCGSFVWFCSKTMWWQACVHRLYSGHSQSTRLIHHATVAYISPT